MAISITYKVNFRERNIYQKAFQDKINSLREHNNTKPIFTK